MEVTKTKLEGVLLIRPEAIEDYREDTNLDIWWPVREPITSQRDEVGHYV